MNNNEMYYISIEYSYTCVYTAYIFGSENMKKAFNEAIEDEAINVGVWKAHITPSGILTYGGIKVMSHIK